MCPEGEVVKIEAGGAVLWQRRKYKRELAFLESTGTQWIDTGLPLTQSNAVEMRISHFLQSKSQIMFGSRSSATQNNFSVLFGNVGSVMSLVLDFCDYKDNRLAYVIDGDENVEISVSNKKLKINDMERAVSKYSDFVTPGNAYLFNGYGSYPSGYAKASARLYECRIYDEKEMVRNFIPVLDWNDVPCLYDKANDQLHYNQGSGKFLYGELGANENG